MSKHIRTRQTSRGLDAHEQGNSAEKTQEQLGSTQLEQSQNRHGRQEGLGIPPSSSPFLALASPSLASATCNSCFVRFCSVCCAYLLYVFLSCSICLPERVCCGVLVWPADSVRENCFKLKSNEKSTQNCWKEWVPLFFFSFVFFPQHRSRSRTEQIEKQPKHVQTSLRESFTLLFSICFLFCFVARPCAWQRTALLTSRPNRTVE